MKLRSSITRYITLVFVLSIAQMGNTQNVFNQAFDEGNISNTTPNALEAFSNYYFVQKIFKNGNTHLQAVIIDTTGAVLQKNEIVTNSNLNIYYGYSGSLQILSTQELCQLYHTALDSSVNLVFFDESLNVTKDIQYDFGDFLNAGVIKQINDSTLIVLGRIQNSSTFNLFLINTDLQGNERWRTTFGEPDKDDYGFAIEFINNKILVGGQTYYSSQLAHPHIYEFSLSGQMVFDTTYTQFDNGGHLTSHQNHGLYLTGVKFNSLGRHPYLVSIHNDFTINWSKEYFSNDTSVAITQMIINQNGTLTMSGIKLVNNEYSGLFFQTNSQGDSLGSKVIDHLPGKLAAFNDIRSTSDGGYILAGQTRAPSQDSWIVKVNEWGCDNIPCIVSVAEAPENAIGTLSCYPNPSNGLGTLKVSFKNTGSNNEIKVFNSLGQLVFSKSVTNKEFEMEVNLPNSGLYLVNLYQGGVLVRSLKWVVN